MIRRWIRTKMFPPTVAGALVLALVLGSAWRGAGFGFSTIDRSQLLAVREALDGSLLLTRDVDDTGEVELIAIALSDGTHIASTTLDRRPHRIVPTPGGVSAFVLWPESNTVTVFDTETLELQREFALSAVRHATELSFSPTGERVFVVDADGTTVVEYRHARLELTEARRFALDGTGSVVTNRRATRLYRVAPPSVHAYFAQTGDLVESYSASLDGTIRFDEQYTALWGVSAADEAVAIDERTGNVYSPATGFVPRRSPAVGSRAAYLSSDGRTVAFFDPRDPAGPDGLLTLAEPAAFLLAAGPNEFWSVANNGSIETIVGGTVRETFNVAADRIVDAVVARIDRAGSFACF